jgi:GT2 family glycosyltransferase
VVGGLRLSAELARDPLMHFAVESGFLGSWPWLVEGEELDFTFLAPGRSSLKRAFLVENGGFDARIARGDDHAELGCRLTPRGLRVIHAGGALTTLVHGYDLEAFLGWLRDQGASRWLLAGLHPGRAAQDASGVEAARAQWRRLAPAAEAILRSARSLDRLARECMVAGLPVTAEEVGLLHRSYRAACAVSRIEGMVEQAAAGGQAFVPDGAAPPADAAPDAPAVSIVIPAYNKWEYTRRCLEAVAKTTPAALHELIVVDNASSDETAEGLRAHPRARVLRNEVNTGFVGACNRGAAAARGRWILFLNNDTEPCPNWLEALLAVGDANPEIGAVGSRLLFADGTLQEAGGIVFRDGTCWLVGRGDVAARWAYRRACEVDYCSGASLMVRRDLFERLGGFDPRFAPAYYEDTDLCFGVRSLGHKVVYCPDSVVVHYEGVTNGTDLNAGAKRHQVLNRARFLHKWREVLARHEQSPQAGAHAPITADRGRRLALAMVDWSSPALGGALQPSGPAPECDPRGDGASRGETTGHG